MANAGAIKGGEAYVEAFLDSSRLMRELGQVERHVQAFGQRVSGYGRRMMTIGAGFLLPMVASVKVFSDIGGNMEDMSARTGVSVGALSELQFAADQTGASLETVEGSLKKMNKTLADAKTGAKEAKEALAGIGLTLKELEGLPPDKQFELIAQKIAAIQNPAKQTSAVMSIFGKSGTMLLPMIKGLTDLRKRAGDLGLTLSQQDTAAADAFGDSVDELFAVLQKTTFVVGGALVPNLQSVAEWMAESTSKMSIFIDQNRELASIFSGLGLGLLATGAAGVLFGEVIENIGSLIGVGKGAVAGLVSWLGWLAVGAKSVGVAAISGIGTAVGAIASMSAPALVAVAAVAALAAGVLYFTGLGSAISSGVGGHFQELSSIASGAFATIHADGVAAFQGISGAMAAGNFGMAAEIIWAAIKLEWNRGTHALQETWQGFKLWFQSAGISAFTGAAKLLNNSFAAMGQGFLSVTNGMQHAWHSMTGFLYRTWNNTFGYILKLWERVKGFVSGSTQEEIAAAEEAIDSGTVLKNERSVEAQEKRATEQEQRQKEYQAHVEKNRVDANTGLDQWYEDAMGSVEDSVSDALRKSQEELEATQKKFDEAVEAGRVAGASIVPSSRKSLLGGNGDPEGDLTAAESKISVASTFDASVASRLGASSPLQERATKAAEETAKTNVEIRDGIKETNSKLDKVPLMKVGA